MQTNYSFNKNEAMGADAGGNGYSEGGVITRAKITRCVHSDRESGSEFFKFNFENLEDGRTLNFVTITTTKTMQNGGGAAFGHAKIMSLLGLLGHQGIQEQPVTDKTDLENNRPTNRVVSLEGQVVGLSFYRKDRWGVKDGKPEVKFDWEHLHFFDPNTGQTFSEKVEGKEPTAIHREIKDTRLDPGNPPASSNGGGFGNAGGGFGGGSGFGDQQQQQNGTGFGGGASNFGEAPQGFGGQQQGGGFNFAQ